jgi:aminomethyltransferase
MLTPRGTFIDDLLVYRRGENRYLLVVNAGNTPKDFAHAREIAKGFDVKLANASDDYALLALQGPDAEAILAPMTNSDLSAIPYYGFVEGSVSGALAIISRTGYTGERGFELYVSPADAPRLFRELLAAGRDRNVLPAGLGARDTLRLEACLALYGNDIDDSHTPWEANLGWIVKMKKGDFQGREALAKQKESGVPRKLVGFEVTGRGIARHGYPLTVDGSAGIVTSGTQTPTVGKPIGLAYVPAKRTAPGTPLAIDVRGRGIPAVVVPTPFYRRRS